MRTHVRVLNYIKQNNYAQDFTPRQRRRLVKKARTDPDAQVTQLAYTKHGPSMGMPSRRGERHLRWAA